MTVLILICSALRFLLHISQLANETKQNEPTPQFKPRRKPRPATRLIPATPAAVAMPMSKLARAHGMEPIREMSLTGSIELIAARSLVACTW